MAFPALDFSGISAGDLDALPKVEEVHRIHVSDFSDTREQQELAFSKDEKVLTSSEPAKQVSSGLRSALRRLGYTQSPMAPVVLRGELRTWKATVQSGFMKSAVADTAIYVEALDPANKRVYGGVYRGYSSYEATQIGAEELEKVLKSCMQQAIIQVLKDKQLGRLLISY